jgi:hypothetical protein
MNLLPDSMKHKNLVAKATSDDETPCPGYEAIAIDPTCSL